MKTELVKKLEEAVEVLETERRQKELEVLKNTAERLSKITGTDIAERIIIWNEYYGTFERIHNEYNKKLKETIPFLIASSI